MIDQTNFTLDCNFTAFRQPDGQPGPEYVVLQYSNGSYLNYKGDLLPGLKTQGQLGLYPASGFLLSIPNVGAPVKKFVRRRSFRPLQKNKLILEYTVYSCLPLLSLSHTHTYFLPQLLHF